jgi:hypothetical protein
MRRAWLTRAQCLQLFFLPKRQTTAKKIINGIAHKIPQARQGLAEIYPQLREEWVLKNISSEYLIIFH